MENSDPVNYELDEIFYRDGVEWIIKVTTDTFIIATRTDIDGEPITDADILKVNR